MLKLSKLLALLLAIGVLLSTTACKPPSWGAPKPYKETQFLMDTIIDITAYGPNAEPAVKAAFAEFKRLHDITNNFDPASQVSKVNDAAGQNKLVVDPDFIEMVRRSNELSDNFGGTFDVTIGPLTDLWGIGRKGDYVPTQEDIDKLLPLVNYHLVELDVANHTIYLPKKGMKLDLGGIAKGYATDKALDILKSYGIKSALINAGGDVRVIGQKPDGTPWRIGVQNPRNQDAVIAKLALTDWDTMETSGDYQRFIMKDGVRYSHILDARTGRQPRQLDSVTMVLNSSTDGDILSTALFILGPEKGLELLKKYPGAEAIMVTTDGKVITSPGLAGKVEITNE